VDLSQKNQRNPPKAISPELKMVLLARLSLSFDPETDEDEKASDISNRAQRASLSRLSAFLINVSNFISRRASR
jgi:hypothetical protein